jgi:hypothetical protein
MSVLNELKDAFSRDVAESRLESNENYQNCQREWQEALSQIDDDVLRGKLDSILWGMIAAVLFCALDTANWTDSLDYMLIPKDG